MLYDSWASALKGIGDLTALVVRELLMPNDVEVASTGRSGEGITKVFKLAEHSASVIKGAVPVGRRGIDVD